MSDMTFPFQSPASETGRYTQSEATRGRPAKRLRHRRTTLALIAGSTVLDGLLLLLYAATGATSLLLGPAFVLCGFLAVGIMTALSETGVSDRFKDHYLTLPMALLHCFLVFAFLFFAPDVAVVFIGSLFLIFIYASLRLRMSEVLIESAVLLTGLGVFLLLTENRLGIPQATSAQRLVTLLTVVTIFVRVSLVGIFSSRLRTSLYDNGVKLQDAYRRIKELAELDELTGAFNRRYIMAALDEEISRSARGSGPCSIALIDLDWFKQINDEYGHPIGDEVLRTFAISVFANIRSIDKFARYGGEEFLIVLPETSGEAARQTLDRLRNIIADLDWSALAARMRVTISAGITTLAPDDDVESALMRADHALYRAKREGRNRVCDNTTVLKPSGHQKVARFEMLESSGQKL